jgi:ribonuclease HI
MEILVFTDGSFIKNKKNEKCGYGIYFPNGELENIAEPFTLKPLTNQRAELFAIYKALELITTTLVFKNIKIFTDSEYSINSLTVWIDSWKKNGWKTANKKPVKNLDIILKTYDILKNNINKIQFYHVLSHTGNDDFLSISNDIVDNLAKKGAYMS